MHEGHEGHAIERCFPSHVETHFLRNALEMSCPVEVTSCVASVGCKVALDEVIDVSSVAHGGRPVEPRAPTLHLLYTTKQ